MLATNWRAIVQHHVQIVAAIAVGGFYI